MFVEIRRRDYSIRTEESYVQWVCRFLSFSMKDEGWTGSDVVTYLEYLAVKRNVTASTQNLALNAIVFFFSNVLEKEVGELGGFARAKRPRNLPVVMTKEEVRMVLDNMTGVPAIMAGLLYGCGLRLMECVRLRVLDIDFGYEQINIHNGKGKKGRVVPLPSILKPLLSEHLSKREALHDEDIRAGYGEVFLPNALSRKYQNAAKEFKWQYVFAATRLSHDPRSGKVRRHHIHETGLQKHIRKAAVKAGIVKRVTSHTFRHSFATHLIKDHYDIRTVQDNFVRNKIGRTQCARWVKDREVFQQLLGHKDKIKGMISSLSHVHVPKGHKCYAILEHPVCHTHVLNRGGQGVRSPLDAL